MSELTGKIIAAAIQVHRALGPGLSEGLYESALSLEMKKNGVRFERQSVLPIVYLGEQIGRHRLDFLVENRVVVELKSVEQLNKLYEAQILNYMRLGKFSRGLLINFNQQLLKFGVRRFSV